MLRILLFTVLGYFSGSILYARVVAGLLNRNDIFERSKDNNPGTANAFMYGGFLCGSLTLCGDLLKGFFPVFIYQANFFSFETEPWGLIFVLAAPVLGHIFSIFSRFQGGKGVAVTFGSLAGLLPYLLPLMLLVAAFITLSLVFRITSHFYRTAAAYLCTMFALVLLRADLYFCIAFFIISAAVFLRLRSSREQREKLEVKLLWMR